MTAYPTVFKPTNDIQVSASECPEHFVGFLFDLSNHIDGSWKKDQNNENVELSRFIEEKISLRISSIFGHVERLLMVIQSSQMVGSDALQEMEDLIAKHEDAYMSWDPAAYQDWLDESEYGSLLSLQELPAAANLYLTKIISEIRQDLIQSQEGTLDSDLYHFTQGYAHYSPEVITLHMGRLFEEKLLLK